MYCVAMDRCKLNCNGLIEYDESIKGYHGSIKGDFSSSRSKVECCTVIENLNSQRRQTELLEKIADKMGIKE